MHKNSSFLLKQFFEKEPANILKEFNNFERNNLFKFSFAQINQGESTDQANQIFQQFNKSNLAYSVITNECGSINQHDSVDTKNNYFEWISLNMTNSYRKNNIESLIYKEIDYTICPLKIKKILKILAQKNKNKFEFKDFMLQIHLYIVYYFGKII